MRQACNDGKAVGENLPWETALRAETQKDEEADEAWADQSTTPLAAAMSLRAS